MRGVKRCDLIGVLATTRGRTNALLTFHSSRPPASGRPLPKKPPPPQPSLEKYSVYVPFAVVALLVIVLFFICGSERRPIKKSMASEAAGHHRRAGGVFEVASVATAQGV